MAVAVGLAACNYTLAANPWNPSAIGRLGLSLGAIAVAFFAGRSRTRLSCALAIIALEACSGIVAFIVVDVPLVTEHRPQIERLVFRTYSLVEKVTHSNGHI